MTNFVGTCSRVIALGLAVFHLVGCASSSSQGTVMAITPGDLGKLSGQWQGTFTAPTGRSFPASLHINSDGTYVSSAEAYSGRGVTQVKDDKLVLVPDPASGPGPAVRTSTATLLMLPDGIAILSGIGAGESGAFSFEMRRVAR